MGSSSASQGRSAAAPAERLDWDAMSITASGHNRSLPSTPRNGSKIPTKSYRSSAQRMSSDGPSSQASQSRARMGRAGASARQRTVCSITREQHRDIGTPALLTSSLIGKGAWAEESLRPRSHQGTQHHLGESQAQAGLKEQKHWPPNVPRYMEEYPEKYVQVDSPSRTRYTRDGQMELGQLDSKSDIESAVGKYETSRRFRDPKVIYNKNNYSGRGTMSNQKNFGDGTANLKVLSSTYLDSTQAAADTVVHDYMQGKPRNGRHNAEVTNAGRTSSLTFMNPEHDVQGAVKTVLASMQELHYQAPGPELLSTLAAESQDMKRTWKIKNGPETFLVHRYTGLTERSAPPAQGVGYPGKWGAQVDDDYHFKRRPGDREKYFQAANDIENGGVAEAMNHDRFKKPHTTLAHSPATHGPQKNRHGKQPAVKRASQDKITSSRWRAGSSSRMDLHTKNSADSGVWLKERPIGFTVKRCDANVNNSNVPLAYEFDSMDNDATARGGYRYEQQTKANAPFVQAPVDKRWTRRTSYFHAHRNTTTPFALHSGPEATEVKPPAPEKPSTAPQASTWVTTNRPTTAILVQKIITSNPAFETTSQRSWQDHTLEAYKTDFQASLVRDTRSLSKAEYARALRAPKPFHPEQNCNWSG